MNIPVIHLVRVTHPYHTYYIPSHTFYVHTNSPIDHCPRSTILYIVCHYGEVRTRWGSADDFCTLRGILCRVETYRQIGRDSHHSGVGVSWTARCLMKFPWPTAGSFAWFGASVSRENFWVCCDWTKERLVKTSSHRSSVLLPLVRSGWAMFSQTFLLRSWEQASFGFPFNRRRNVSYLSTPLVLSARFTWFWKQSVFYRIWLYICTDSAIQSVVRDGGDNVTIGARENRQIWSRELIIERLDHRRHERIIGNPDPRRCEKIVEPGVDGWIAESSHRQVFVVAGTLRFRGTGEVQLFLRDEGASWFLIDLIFGVMSRLSGVVSRLLSVL